MGPEDSYNIFIITEILKHRIMEEKLVFVVSVFLDPIGSLVSTLWVVVGWSHFFKLSDWNRNSVLEECWIGRV